LDIKEYISSGVIEAYVLGMATDEEIRELELLCSQHPEVQQALEEAEQTLGNLAMENRKQVPAELKSTILQSLVSEGLVEEEKEITMDTDVPRRQSINWYALVAAACVLLLVIGAIYHMNTVNRLKTELSILSAQQKSLLVENTNFREDLENRKQELTVATKASVAKYSLAGVAGHEGSSATLYWDQDTKEVYLLPLNLPALPSGKQYQLWAIVDGKPVNAGVYGKNDFSVLQKMLSTDRAEMFAITMENEGGVEEPTLDQMVVAAKI